MPIDFELTTYHNVYGESRDYEALVVTWAQVNALLGREHLGTAEDDQAIVDALLESAGVPEWAREASGFIGECGWGLIGPLAPDNH